VLRNYLLLTAQVLLIAGILISYWLFSRNLLHIHFLAIANFFSAALLINFASMLVREKQRFYLAMLSSSVLVIGFFFSVVFIPESYRIPGYALFLAPATLSLIAAVRGEI